MCVSTHFALKLFNTKKLKNIIMREELVTRF